MCKREFCNQSEAPDQADSIGSALRKGKPVFIHKAREEARESGRDE